MNRILTVTVMGLCLAAEERALAQGTVERGQQVYAAEKCSICHSVAGVGNKRGALDEVASRLTADEIRQWIVNAPEMATKANATRKPLMKGFAHLSKEDVDGLVAYLQSLKKP
jgi:mono/diheme cytochrome c family protein